MLFTVVYAGLTPRIALEVHDSGEVRIEKIIRLIKESKLAVHDISRIRAKEAGELFRLNMPFELGLDFGARRFGASPLHKKRCLVLEKEPHRYKAALSDLSGCDISNHRNSPVQVVVAVRNWLATSAKVAMPGPSVLWNLFSDCMADLERAGYSRADLRTMPVPELIEYMTT